MNPSRDIVEMPDLDQRAFGSGHDGIVSRLFMILALLIPFADAQFAAAAIPADEIRSAIVADFEDAESLPADQLKVTVTNNGIVTLSGTVSNLMDKRRASDLCKRIRDVRGVNNQVLVQTPSRSDQEIRDDVLMRLKTNDSLDRKEIVVAVENGSVAMTGRVDSLAEKRLAEIAASGVRGIVDVDNQLTVGLDPERTDQDLKEEVKALIVNSVYLDDLNIDVRVKDAVVQLSGSVGSAQQRDRLQRVAGIWGVASVDVNDVSVNPEMLGAKERKRRIAAVDDGSIRDATELVFRNDPVVFLAADAIKIGVTDGVVSLDGNVDRLQTKRRAERLAMDVVGVIRVNNDLEIQPRESSADPTKIDNATIIDETQQALERSVYLERREIRVHCSRGHVSLYGLVDNELEKRVAEWIASGIPGVVHVNNALAVEAEWTPKSDAAIASDLRRKLKTVLFAEGNDIEVQVVDGVAVLSGTVDTWRQWQAAMDLAIEAGSRTPHNLIEVRYHPPHGASRVYVPR